MSPLVCVNAKNNRGGTPLHYQTLTKFTHRFRYRPKKISAAAPLAGPRLFLIGNVGRSSVPRGEDASSGAGTT
jgi:hypothetical protein